MCLSPTCALLLLLCRIDVLRMRIRGFSCARSLSRAASGGQRSNTARVFSKMRRSARNSFKAELEEGTQNTHKSKSLERKDGGCASIRMQADKEEGDHNNVIEEKDEEVRDTDSSSDEDSSTRMTRKSARNTTERFADQEPEEEGVEGEGEGLSVHGRWRHYNSLCSRLPGRERQIQLLLSLLGEVGFWNLRCCCAMCCSIIITPQILCVNIALLCFSLTS